jgi:hypothetical protein
MRSLKTLITMLVVGICVALPGWAQSQASGVPNDWSHHRLIFSKPSPPELKRLQQEPRYQMQQAWRGRQASSAAALDAQALQIVHSWGRPAMSNDGRWSQNMGSGATVGAAQYPAKYSFSINTANCASPGPPDFVVFNNGLMGGFTIPQATIIAYDNLYRGCSGAVPSVYWQYNTAFTGTNRPDASKIVTSVTLSGDGSQVAFVQTNPSKVATLVLLKWANNPSLVQMNTGTRNFTASFTALAKPHA